MTVAQRLVAVREQGGYTRRRLAETLHRPYSTLAKYETGEREPSFAYLVAFARLFGVSTDYLLGLDAEQGEAPELEKEALRAARDYAELDGYGRSLVDTVLRHERDRCQAQAAPVIEPVEREEEEKRIIPLYRTAAAAGYVAPTEGEDYDDYEIDADLPGDFAVRIEGDSMEPYIHDGEIVRCIRTNGLQIGDVGIFYVDGDTLCKQYCTDGMNLYLLSLNRERADADRTIWHFSNSTVQLYGKVLTRRKPPMP